MNSRRMHQSIVLSLLGLSLYLHGCASTTVQTSGNASHASLCQARGESLAALVLWGPIWRSDQKDVPLREEAAQHGLDEFFSSSRCFTNVEVRRLPGGHAAVVPSDQELLSLAAASSPMPDRVLVVTVRELGPVVKLLGSPALLEGGTEVILGLTAIDVSTGSSLAKFQTHWHNGGAMVIKGVSTLPQDMSAALRAAMSPASPPQ